jgi:hypothetical protein
MLRKYTESLISNIEKRFSDSLEILKAFDIFNPFPVPERETLEFTADNLPPSLKSFFSSTIGVWLSAISFNLSIVS